MASWLEDIIHQKMYNFITTVINSRYSSTEHTYTDPEDDEEDDESQYEYVSTVVVGTPLRETKCIFVPEMNDFYTDEELNTVYHSADEYRYAIDKYGLVYKSQKFENADTAEKLLEYSKDWIKNNYHGGISNFSVTALDLHILNPEFDKYLVGQQAAVCYMDPATRNETTQTLTVISAEYDLNNPEKNSYKIGIPDVTLNKVYGETSKSGGGGGGGGKSSDETDDETNTEVDGLADKSEEDAARKLELLWGLIYKGMKDGDTSFSLGELETPNTKDPTSDWSYGLTADIMKSGAFQGVNAVIDNVNTKYVRCSGNLSGEEVKANKGSITDIVADTADVKDLKKGGVDVATVEDIPPIADTLDLTINGNLYRLIGKPLN